MAVQEFTTDELESEEWRAINGFDGYEVSDLGRIRSTLSTHRGFSRPPRLLNPCPTAQGYPLVNLRRDGSTFPRLLHCLVLEAFIGLCPAGLEGCHGDGQSLNNRLNNLRWDTRKANHDDSIRHGTANLNGLEEGRKPRPKKYTPEQVRFVRANQDRYSKQELSARSGMHLSSVKHVLNGHSWRSLKD